MNRHKRLSSLALLLALVGFALAGCAQQKAALPEAFSRDAMENGAASLEMPAEAAPAKSVAFQNAAPEVASRLVIRNADMEIVVDDPAQAADAISKMAESMGGFVVSSKVYESTSASGVQLPYGSVTVRVPAEQFQAAIGQIEALAVRVERKDITGKDVTEEYVDLQARLKNLEAARDELQRLMHDATTTDDVLAVYRELTQVQGEIEQIKGRIKYLKTSAAMSAISVRLTPSAAAKTVSIGGWHPSGVAKDALVMLARTLRGLLNLVIWVVIYLIPTFLALGIVFGLPAWGFYRLARRWWRKRHAPQPQEPPTPAAASPPSENT